MKQQQFEQQHGALWEEISAILENRSPQPGALPALYRRLSQCLALAEQRGYSPALTDYLHALSSECHMRLYGTVAERPRALMQWMLHDFPCRVRSEWRLLVAAMLAFWATALVLGLLVWYQPQWAYSFMDPDQLEHMRHMYSPGSIRLGRGGAEGDVMMFGYYIWNNVSIGFRTFAGGIFGGLPALFSLAFNGVHLGIVASWLSRDPATTNNFWSFVITHSSFEITGLVLSGMAGMRMGLAMLAPGRMTRRHALVTASRAMFPVAVGAALLTVLAAFVEAFWSASTAISPVIKYAVGGGCWIAVIAFLVLAGRTKAKGSDAA
ncbi:stage II sporulation protein M [Pseudoduganella ginsengisoli]|uniref:Stage II sporulation protein M n=1 Tax=Pseudoduganella ginsengisoli TaxID=1462440 RepID=A0A6L6Q6N8_9BURK|nr:stage II sporulation protein M [Pseudoduganella ginsengisoli]MTW05109.1 stage II sporulation protein M [Pseudoduganella ginsengisoli]